MRTLSFLFLIALSFGCADNVYKNDYFADTIKYAGEDYELSQKMPMAFAEDTIIAELWFRTLNVDGDNSRIVRLVSGKKTSIFPLCNAVNNFTTMTFYSIKLGAARILWIEDNFGTTVLDIDKCKLKKVKHPTKKLTEIAETGAPYGMKKPVSPKLMLFELGIMERHNLLILDSLSVGL